MGNTAAHDLLSLTDPTAGLTAPTGLTDPIALSDPIAWTD